MTTGRIHSAESCKTVAGRSHRQYLANSRYRRVPRPSQWPERTGRAPCTSSGLASGSSSRAGTATGSSSVSWLWFLHVDRQGSAFSGNDSRHHLGNEQAGPSELRAVKQDYSVRTQFCRLLAEDGFLEAISEKARLALEVDLTKRFVRRCSRLVAVHLHVFPVCRAACWRGLCLGYSGGVTAAQHCEREAGKKKAGGASCARSHDAQDAKDFPLGDSPPVTNRTGPDMRRHQVGP